MATSWHTKWYILLSSRRLKINYRKITFKFLGKKIYFQNSFTHPWIKGCRLQYSALNLGISIQISYIFQLNNNIHLAINYRNNPFVSVSKIIFLICLTFINNLRSLNTSQRIDWISVYIPAQQYPALRFLFFRCHQSLIEYANKTSPHREKCGTCIARPLFYTCGKKKP